MNWRIIITQRFSHKNESSDPPHKAPQPRAPALGRQARRAFSFEGQQAGTEGFPGGSVVKNPLAYSRDTVSIPWSEDPLGKEMATHSSILALEIP